MTSINTLPSEILSQILILHAHDVFSNAIPGLRTPLIDLFLVCRRWAGIAQTTPELWGFLDIPDDDGFTSTTAMVKKRLHRSGITPLFFRLSIGSPSSPGLTTAEFQMLFAIIVPDIWRMTTLKLHILSVENWESCLEALQFSTRTNFLALREAHIIYSLPPSAIVGHLDRPQDCFHAPTLEYLNIEGPQDDLRLFTTSSFQSLRRFAFRYTPTFGGVDLSDLSRVLQTMHACTTLRFAFSTIYGGPVIVKTLEHTRSLSLIEASSAWISKFLCNIAFPKLTSLTLVLYPGKDNRSTSLAEILSTSNITFFFLKELKVSGAFRLSSCCAKALKRLSTLETIEFSDITADRCLAEFFHEMAALNPISEMRILSFPLLQSVSFGVNPEPGWSTRDLEAFAAFATSRTLFSPYSDHKTKLRSVALCVPPREDFPALKELDEIAPVRREEVLDWGNQNSWIRHVWAS